MNTKVLGGSNFLISLFALFTLFRYTVFTATHGQISIEELTRHWFIFPLLFIFIINLFLSFLMFLRFDQQALVMVCLTMTFSSFMFLNFAISKVNTIISNYEHTVATRPLF
ncbi:hypothetical protein KAZ57_02510 [Patescibacteria group bacterium]|nr:hypothetical protein [Patescibacteria group bacterium]